VPLGQGPEDCLPRRDTEGGFSLRYVKKLYFPAAPFQWIQQFTSMRIRSQESYMVPVLRNRIIYYGSGSDF
jgi:hypothetical protein